MASNLKMRFPSAKALFSKHSRTESEGTLGQEQAFKGETQIEDQLKHRSSAPGQVQGHFRSQPPNRNEERRGSKASIGLDLFKSSLEENPKTEHSLKPSLNQNASTLLRRTSVLAGNGLITPEIKSELKDLIVSGDIDAAVKIVHAIEVLAEDTEVDTFSEIRTQRSDKVERESGQVLVEKEKLNEHQNGEIISTNIVESKEDEFVPGRLRAQSSLPDWEDELDETTAYLLEGMDVTFTTVTNIDVKFQHMLKDAENLKRAHLILKRMEELYAVVQTATQNSQSSMRMVLENTLTNAFIIARDSPYMLSMVLEIYQKDDKLLNAMQLLKHCVEKSMMERIMMSEPDLLSRLQTTLQALDLLVDVKNDIIPCFPNGTNPKTIMEFFAGRIRDFISNFLSEELSAIPKPKQFAVTNWPNSFGENVNEEGNFNLELEEASKSQTDLLNKVDCNSLNDVNLTVGDALAFLGWKENFEEKMADLTKLNTDKSDSMDISTQRILWLHTWIARAYAEKSSSQVAIWVKNVREQVIRGGEGAIEYSQEARFRTHTPELLINCIQQQLDLAKEHGLDEAVMIPLATTCLRDFSKHAETIRILLQKHNPDHQSLARSSIAGLVHEIYGNVVVEDTNEEYSSLEWICALINDSQRCCDWIQEISEKCEEEWQLDSEDERASDLFDTISDTIGKFMKVTTDAIPIIVSTIIGDLSKEETPILQKLFTEEWANRNNVMGTIIETFGDYFNDIGDWILSKNITSKVITQCLFQTIQKYLETLLSRSPSLNSYDTFTARLFQDVNELQRAFEEFLEKASGESTNGNPSRHTTSTIQEYIAILRDVVMILTLPGDFLSLVRADATDVQGRTKLQGFTLKTAPDGSAICHQRTRLLGRMCIYFGQQAINVTETLLTMRGDISKHGKQHILEGLQCSIEDIGAELAQYDNSRDGIALRRTGTIPLRLHRDRMLASLLSAPRSNFHPHEEKKPAKSVEQEVQEEKPKHSRILSGRLQLGWLRTKS